MTLPSLLTVGHGTADQDTFTRLLERCGVQRLVDVRSFPGSRRNPHMSRESLQVWLPAAGVEYLWERRLGGRRRLPADSPDVWWQVAAFRAYAAHMRTEEFQAGLAWLTEQVAGARTAIMCSESLWWRCHRRMISDFAVAVAGWTVQHLGHDGALTAHPVAPGARVEHGLLFYDRV
jgi:uncharacterized protein (DUF488 family)